MLLHTCLIFKINSEVPLYRIHQFILLSSIPDAEILQKIALEVVETIKGRIGDEEFTKRIADCNKLFASKAEGRKRKQKVLLIVRKMNLLLFSSKIANVVYSQTRISC